MRQPSTVIKSHCDKLEYYQQKLCLKDNGTNTEEILFLLREFEQVKSQILVVTDFSEASTIYLCLLQDPQIRHLMKKYGLDYDL